MIDTPFLWHDLLSVALQSPPECRSNKWLINQALAREPDLAKIPLSSGPSWNTQLELYCSGVWEELLDYVVRWNPWQLEAGALRDKFLKPPLCTNHWQGTEKILKNLKQNRLLRAVGERYFPHWQHTTMEERILLRIGLITDLYQKIV